MKKDFIKYLVALLLFGSNGAVAGFIALNSYEIVFLRTLIGFLLLFVIFVLKKGRWTFFKKKKHFLFIVFSGVAMGASWLFLYEAYSQMGVGVSSMLYYCGPVLVMALSPFLFKERLTVFRIIGFSAVFLGAVLINGNFLLEKSNFFGIFCGSCSAVMYAVMIVFNKKAKDITGCENSCLQLLFAFLTSAVFLCTKQSLMLEIGIGDIVPVLILGLLNTGLGCYLYFFSIGSLSVHTVSVCGYLEPLSALIFSALFLSERLSLNELFGAVLILGGAIFAECFGKKHR